MKDCKLIATIPSLNNMNKVKELFRNEHIAEVRYNTGTVSPYSVQESLRLLKQLSTAYNKKLWIDIKGRQLRVTEWGNPLFSCISINHNIKVSEDAKIYLRNGEYCNIKHVVDGHKIFVDPLPKHAVGAGQSVNILDDDLQIEGYLTAKDIEVIERCTTLGMKSFMLSFVESASDVAEVLNMVHDAELVLKIESQKGMEFVLNTPIGVRYMAARDDLYIQTGVNMIKHLKTIIQKDKSAICASRILLSLEKGVSPEFCDYADLEYMYSLGYKEFMLCDNICNYALEPAVNAWCKWKNR